MEITFRPHHFLCALCFQGKGYSPLFIANFQTIMDKLNSPGGDATVIQVTTHTDSICAPCPNRIGRHCATEEKIAVLDHAHTDALQLKTETILTWGEAKQRIKEKMTLESFHQICATCSWKQYGICESVLTAFLKNK